MATSRYDFLAAMLTPRQMEEFNTIASAIREDPMCLEHHKAHVKDKTGRQPTEDTTDA